MNANPNPNAPPQTTKVTIIETGVFGANAHLHRLRKSYFAYYHRSRTHLGLDKDAPEPRLVRRPAEGQIVAFPEVGGLHHRYDRLAA